MANPSGSTEPFRQVLSGISKYKTMQSRNAGTMAC